MAATACFYLLFRYMCKHIATQRCQSASGKNSATDPTKPRHLSLTISRTLFNPRCFKSRRKPLQPALSSLLPSASEDLPTALFVNADSNQHRDSLYLAAPTALQADPIQIHIGKLTLNRSGPPCLNTLIDLLVEVTEG